jgi:hypothetical protein
LTLSSMSSEVGVVKVEYFVEGSPRTTGHKLFDNYTQVSENTELYRIIQHFSDETYSSHFRLESPLCHFVN